MDPDVVCADALTANISRTKTSIGLKYVIPSPFLAVCVIAEEFSLGANLQISGKPCQAKLVHFTGKMQLLYRYSDRRLIQKSAQDDKIPDHSVDPSDFQTPALRD